MVYTYGFQSPNGESVEWESSVMLTRQEAKEKAWTLLNCRLGPIAEAQDPANSFVYDVTLASGVQVRVRAPYELSQSAAVTRAIELRDCRVLIEAEYANFTLNTVERVPTTQYADSSTSDSNSDSSSASVIQDNVLTGWIIAGVFIALMLRQLGRAESASDKSIYLLLTFLAAALYGFVWSTTYENFSLGFTGGSNSAYSLYPSLLVQDLVEVTVPFILGLLSHLGARRVVRKGIV